MTLGTFQHEEVEGKGQRKLGRNSVAEGRTVDWQTSTAIMENSVEIP